ncbi:iron ABC transporter substrate-binding protein [Xylanibacillus composti]|uniref:Iron ABC transporter substrate-binding protein n=2 Tax=Xylanibacillus composti TaxID=1572762 RepID=A0A8J4H0P4_9BACL|nr:iron ABC transporter substrate-binding protein [Xylanibacillus composti]
MVISHQLGEATVEKNPQTVVVFDNGTLDTLDKLGIEVAAVPQASLPSYLSKYEGEQYVNAGTLFEPDFETIYGLQPDVIFISGRTSEAYEELNEIAPTVFVGLDTANYMESFEHNAKMIGELFGKEAEVEQELESIRASIEKLQTVAGSDDKKALMILTTGGKISAYGPGSRFGLLHDVMGFAPVDENLEVSTHGQSVSFEYIAEKNPDYLFVIDRDAVVSGENVQPAQEVIENDLVKNTNAYKDGNIVYVDAEFWYLSGGGLISVAEMVKEVAEGIQ